MKISFRGPGALPLVAIQGVVAYEWIHAGAEKLSAPGYVSGMSKTISTFAAKNPNAPYKSFLTDTVAPNSQGFAYVVEYGELLAGIGLAVAALIAMVRVTPRLVETLGTWLTVLAGIGGAFMSANFYFAAGWTGASTEGINLVMTIVQVALVAMAIGALVSGTRALGAFETMARTGQTVEEPRPRVAVR